MSVMVAYRWPVRVLVATMLTPGSGTLPAFTVPCTSPPATVPDTGVDGADGLLGAVLEGGAAGSAAGEDCAPAGVMREPLNRQKIKVMRRIKSDFLCLSTQLRPSSRPGVLRFPCSFHRLSEAGGRLARLPAGPMRMLRFGIHDP